VNHTHDNDNDAVVLISPKEACRLTSLSRTQIDRYRQDGRFPASVTLGDKRIAFVRSEVMDWIKKKIEGRKAA
jgi:prophage regulatory protein